MQNITSTRTKFSMAVNYDPSKRLTTIFVHGPEPDEISNLFDNVKSNLSNIALPTLIPTLLFRERLASAVQKVKDSHNSIIGVEEHTGVKTKWRPDGSWRPDISRRGKQHDENRLHAINFDQVTDELTSILNKMAYCEFVCNVYLPMLDDLDNMNNNIAAVSSETKDAVKLAQRNLRAQNEFLRTSFKGTLRRSQYLSKRAQALVQTVYSLISQRENALSMRDNAELKKISENQARVAIAASRDSAAMRVIAAITTVFLPATFTAVRIQPRNE